MDSPSGYYINSAATPASGNPSALIKCTEGKCIAVDAGNNSFYISASEGLMKCGNGNGCSIVADVTNDSGTDYTKGYVLDYSALVEAGTSTNLISCTSTKCTNPTTLTNGYYIDRITGTNIIHCVDGTCKTSAHSASATTPKYYLDATTKKVIKCNNTKCELIDKPIKGYYLNSGDSGKEVIQCNGAGSNPCSEASAITSDSCEKVGNIVSSTNIYICFTDDSSLTLANAAVQIQSATNAANAIQYKTLFLDESSDFPGASTKTVNIKINNDGSAYILEVASLPTCGDTCDGKHCIKESSGKKLIYNNGGIGSTCKTITGTASKTGMVYFKTDGTSVDPDSGTPDMAYSCTYGSDGNATKCELVKGYTQTATKTVQCSGWKDDPCSVVATSGIITGCASTDDGNLGIFSSVLSVCFSDDETYGGINLPTSDSVTTYYLFYTNEINKYYGLGKHQFLSLALTSSSATVTQATGIVYK